MNVPAQTGEKPMIDVRHRNRSGLITVVVVDDHLLVAESVAAILDCAYDVAVVAVAGTGTQGVAEVLLHQPDVLLLDQRLPDGLGTDLLPALKRSSPRTRVLLLTASDTENVLRRALEGGCAGVVAKDQRPGALLDAVRGAASGKTVFSAEDLRRLLPLLVYPQSGKAVDLTAREHEVLAFLVDGRDTAWIADNLVISFFTARNHIQSIIRKLGGHSRLEAVAIALREGIVAAP
jgi:DNA-binding NarL/FixJ family response regulator